MDIDKIKELLQLMADHDVAELSVRNGEETVELRRCEANSNHSAPAPRVAEAAALPAPALTPAEPIAPVDPDAGLIKIASPMVGTFYTSSKPGSPPFVQAGAAIHADTVVCIIEAMKVFNEIKADVSGVIERVLVPNESAVEYGQPLFAVRPA